MRQRVFRLPGPEGPRRAGGRLCASGWDRARSVLEDLRVGEPADGVDQSRSVVPVAARGRFRKLSRTGPYLVAALPGRQLVFDVLGAFAKACGDLLENDRK